MTGGIDQANRDRVRGVQTPCDVPGCGHTLRQHNNQAQGPCRIEGCWCKHFMENWRLK